MTTPSDSSRPATAGTHAPATSGTHADVIAQMAASKRRRRTRKLLYVGAILLLLIPIIFLGRPADAARGADGAARLDETGGGLIAQQRAEFDLGEGNLGDIDPASSSLNLMLLGLRGMAVNQLWLEAIEEKERKQWNELERTTNTITLLQPHFVQVWKFQSWNMAYNVSAEFDADEDRFAWVKKGAKYLKKGTDRNTLATELYHDRGQFIGSKIGHSDERRQFRRYFLADPDVEQWGGGPDTDLNPDGVDNYLVAKGLYEEANRVADQPGAIRQTKIAEAIFRGYPQKALIDLAASRQAEGLFDEATRAYWQQAFDEWTGVYGRIKFENRGLDVYLESEPAERVQMAEDQNVSLAILEGARDGLQKMINYPYWRSRTLTERTEEMAEARRILYEGKLKFLGDTEDGLQDFDTAETMLVKGLTMLESLIGDEGANLIAAEDAAEAASQNRPADDEAFNLDENQRDAMQAEDTLKEAIIKSQLMYQYILRLDDREDELAGGFPLKEVWDDNPELVADFDEQLRQKMNTN